jgi:hypothetical protein
VCCARRKSEVNVVNTLAPAPANCYTDVLTNRVPKPKFCVCRKATGCVPYLFYLYTSISLHWFTNTLLSSPSFCCCCCMYWIHVLDSSFSILLSYTRSHADSGGSYRARVVHVSPPLHILGRGQRLARALFVGGYQRNLLDVSACLCSQSSIILYIDYRYGGGTCVLAAGPRWSRRRTNHLTPCLCFLLLLLKSRRTGVGGIAACGYG